ncbi:MAG: lipase [Cyanobacteria bacterium J003]|nr:MAG: lipase [Cyanobacteria bacterium J003]
MLPVVVLPGYLAAAPDYYPLRDDLRQLGFVVEVVPLRTRSWLPTLGGRSVAPILRALDTTIQSVLNETGAPSVYLIGHSAGGWISRIYLGDQPYDGKVWAGHKWVHTLITLGTPHRSQERWTRRNLDFVNTTYPGAYYGQIRYVCLAGKAIYGTSRGSFANWLTYQSYKLTCGEGACWGDGVTPVAAAHLEGAENLVYENVLHAPRRRLRDRPDAPWYGSPEIVAHWQQYLRAS